MTPRHFLVHFDDDSFRWRNAVAAGADGLNYSQ
jgi:hypothetical protein